MKTKICFKCGIEKPLTDYYVHKQMGDGHLNKCKECTKSDVKKDYLSNIEREEYVEKERLRGRLKYAKYKYKTKEKNSYSSVNKGTSRHLKVKGVDLNGKEIHHWRYTKEHKNDVFILNPRAHALVHKDLRYELEYNCFIVLTTDKLLDSKEKMFLYIKSLFELNQVNYEIDKYPF